MNPFGSQIVCVSASGLFDLVEDDLERTKELCQSFHTLSAFPCATRLDNDCIAPLFVVKAFWTQHKMSTAPDTISRPSNKVMKTHNLAHFLLQNPTKLKNYGIAFQYLELEN